MKTFISFVFFAAVALRAAGQGFMAPDTVFREYFQSDLSIEMLLAPTGFDQSWINFNQDGNTSSCAEGWQETPGGWYWESDLSTNEPTSNDVFSSCSFLLGTHLQNRNWLITPPIEVDDPSYYLSWRSLAVQGPLYTDGYKVLISSGSNDPALNQYDTVFVAAQMLFSAEPGSLELSDYTFSPGYIHANGFSDTLYYFVDSTLNEDGELVPYYHGRFEPHGVSLADYAGQTIYIAFVHDSRDDFILQLDDVAITRTTVRTAQPDPNVLEFNVSPNPVDQHARIHWTLREPQPVRLEVLDALGRLCWQGQYDHSPALLDWNAYAPGIYLLRLRSAGGESSRIFVKN